MDILFFHTPIDVKFGVNCKGRWGIQVFQSSFTIAVGSYDPVKINAARQAAQTLAPLNSPIIVYSFDNHKSGVGPVQTPSDSVYFAHQSACQGKAIFPNTKLSFGFGSVAQTEFGRVLAKHSVAVIAKTPDIVGIAHLGAARIDLDVGRTTLRDDYLSACILALRDLNLQPREAARPCPTF